jgi:hypothetical protein
LISDYGSDYSDYAGDYHPSDYSDYAGDYSDYARAAGGGIARPAAPAAPAAPRRPWRVPGPV